MYGKIRSGALHILLGAAIVGSLLTGCRQQETAPATVADTEITESEVAPAQEQGESVAAVPSESAAAVTPIPYRAPVVEQPQAPPRVAPPPVAQPVVAQYPPPTAQSAPPPRPTPVLVTVPSGTVMRVRLDNHLSSHSSQVGQQFTGTVIQDIAAEGRVAIREGATVLGRVTEAEPAKKIGGRARLSLAFDSLDLGSGQTRPMSAQFAQKGKSQTAKDAAIIGGSTIGGAIIGEAIEDGEGGVIGAIVGGLGGAYAAKKTKAKPVEVPAGTVLDLELTQPITLEIFPD